MNPLHKRTPRIDFFIFDFFQQFFSKIWTLLIEIEPFFSTWVKENDSILYDSKILFFFAKCMTQRMNWSFLENMTLRIEFFERKTYSKNWTFSKIDSMDWTFCFTWPKELNLFFLYNSKDWTFSSFLNPFSTIALNDWPCFEHDSQNWTFLFKMTQRIEHMTWLKVLIELFKNITQRIECFLNMTHRIEPLFFWIWLQEFFVNICFFFQKKKKITDLNPFQHDSEKMNRISKIWLTELNPLHKRTQRIGP